MIKAVGVAVHFNSEPHLVFRLEEDGELLLQTEVSKNMAAFVVARAHGDSFEDPLLEMFSDFNGCESLDEYQLLVEQEWVEQI